MKQTDLIKLIREEIDVVMREDDNFQASYDHMRPYLNQLNDVIKALSLLNDRIEVKGPRSEEIEDALDSLNTLTSLIQNKTQG